MKREREGGGGLNGIVKASEYLRDYSWGAEDEAQPDKEFFQEVIEIFFFFKDSYNIASS